MLKSRYLKLSLLSAESLYYYTYNQVYKSRIDLLNFHHINPPNLKVKLLNRISNENCKVIDFLAILSTVNTSSEYSTYVIPAINMVQNFFSELNQDKELYNQILDLESRYSHSELKQKENTLRFLRILKEDFELKSGIGHSHTTQVNIINCLTKIDEFSQDFGSSLTIKSQPVLFPKALFQDLPKELQQYINNYVAKENTKPEEGTIQFVKPVFTYSQLASVFTNCPNPILARRVFEICLNFNRNSLFVLHNLIKERTNYATYSGFENYLHFQMSSLTSWKHSKVTFQENLSHLKSFIKNITDMYQEEASQTLFYLQKYLPKDCTTLNLSDIFYLRNKLIHHNYAASGFTFRFSSILDFLTKITSRLFNLTLTFEECEGIHCNDQIVLVKVQDLNDMEIGSIYLDLFSRKDKADLNQQFFIQSGTNVAIPENLVRNQKPQFYISCNISKIDGESEIKNPLSYELNFHAVKTLVHEFGHCINNILNSDTYQLVSSTLLIDYAETMAALFEKICIHPIALENYFATYSHDNNNNVLTNLHDLAAIQEVFRPWNLLEQIFYANVDLNFHSLSRDKLKSLTPKQLSTIYAEALKTTYGKVSNLDISNYENLSWFTNIEHLGSYGGLYFAYLLADYYSERIVRGAVIKGIFEKDDAEKILNKGLINYLFRNAHSEDIFNKLWIE